MAHEMGARDLVDPFGRVVRDLRISVTDRCNFRCTYCMPEEGMQWLPRSEVLTFEEIERLARICVERFGFDGIRLTGGEPTVRAHLAGARRQAAPRLGVDLAMTPTAPRCATSPTTCAQAGLNRVNISLDTLDRAKFERMTRRDELRQRARRHRRRPGGRVRPGQDQRRRRARRQRRRDRRPRHVRSRARASRCGSSSSCRSTPSRRTGSATRSSARTRSSPRSTPCARSSRCRPGARRRPIAGATSTARGTVGVIPTVTKPFCGDCDRVRLTADGQFRTCLFATDEFDLRDVAAERRHRRCDVAACIERAVGTKWAGHQINQVNFIRPGRSMSQIGG